MSERDGGATWPEQEAIFRWWNKHRHELIEAATEYRLKVQRQANASPWRPWSELDPEEHWRVIGLWHDGYVDIVEPHTQNPMVTHWMPIPPLPETLDTA